MGLQGKTHRLPGGVHAAVGIDNGADGRVFAGGMGAYHADVPSHDLHAVQLAAQRAGLRENEALRPDGGVYRWLSSPGVAVSVTLCIYVTHLIYAFVLIPSARRRGDESWLRGRFSFGNLCVHYVTPGLVVLQWLLWQDKAGLTVGHAVWWLVLPLAYFAFAMLRAGTGKPIGRTGQLYPYPFLDYPRLGAGRFWLYATAILTFFFGLGCLFVGIGHLLA